MSQIHLRRKSDGHILPWNRHLAKHEDWEEFDIARPVVKAKKAKAAKPAHPVEAGPVPDLDALRMGLQDGEANC